MRIVEYERKDNSGTNIHRLCCYWCFYQRDDHKGDLGKQYARVVEGLADCKLIRQIGVRRRNGVSERVRSSDGSI